MAGTGIVESAPPGIDDKIEDGDEHALLDVVADKCIYPCQYFRGVFEATRLRSQRGPDHRHDQGTGNALARNVGHGDAQSILIDFHKVVVIAANLFRRFIEGCQLVPFKFREFHRQQCLLDLLCHLHFFLQALLIGQVLLRIAEFRLNIAERACNFADLGRLVDVHLVPDLALAEMLDPLGEFAKWIHDQIDEQSNTGVAQAQDKKGELQAVQSDGRDLRLSAMG